jgi:hypothetical protein
MKPGHIELPVSDPQASMKFCTEKLSQVLRPIRVRSQSG